MAFWSKLEGCKSFEMIDSSFESLRTEETQLKSSFDELVSVFLEETCSRKCVRPLPPMLGNGCCINLLKLYFIVKLKGGFDAILRKKLWDEVGYLYGLGLGVGSALKLVYLKYLDSLESWLVKLQSSGRLKSEKFSTGVWSKGVLMVLGLEYSSFVSNIMVEMRKRNDAFGVKDEKSGISFIDLTQDEDENENGNAIENGKVDWNKFVMSFEENEDKTKSNAMVETGFADGVGFSGENHNEENFKQIKSEMSYVGIVSSDGSDGVRSSISPIVVDDVVKRSENSYKSKKSSNVMDSSVVKGIYGLKRKRDSLSRMLEWIVKVARDPTSPNIGTIPESYRWEAYGKDNYWKQVLLAREVLFRKNIDSAIYQKKQKIHPSMFDNNPGHPERPRISARLYVEKSRNSPPIVPPNPKRPKQRLKARLDMQPAASIYTHRPFQRIPIGIDFQVDVPKWTGVVIESDLKWLGTQVWPLEKKKDNLLIDRDLVGKGRLDPCGCLFPGTTECMKFHISKKRINLNNELDVVFYAWRFDMMGEEIRVSWTPEEESMFKSVVKANSFSRQKHFWKQMCEALPGKSWVDQVNYYYNVFLLQRRAFQNRFTPRNIDSDDDETEYGLVTTTPKNRTESCASVSSSKLA